jgi:propanol-preferring alcohol dehydrogenase
MPRRFCTPGPSGIVSRRDVREFLELAARIPIIPEVAVYSLEQANEALCAFSRRDIRGAKVLSLHQ